MSSIKTKPAAERAPARRPSRVPIWVKGLLPLGLLVVLLAVFFQTGPIGVFQQAFPPVEELTIERITLPEPGELRVRVVNGGPEAVTIAQVLVDDASWSYSIDGEPRIGRLQTRTLSIPFPWVEGDPHEVTLLTNTGLTFSAEVPVAVRSPSVDARYLSTFALLGIYVGVIPVFLGLLWLPFLRQIRQRWIDFFLSLTAGLLIFLGADALAESIEIAERVPGAFQGLGLVLLGLVGTPLALSAVGQARARPAAGSTSGDRSPLYVAGLIALGIGLHNLGEGLAIGGAYATGEIALGTFLVVGFLLHNTTEGLGIVAPLSRERPRLVHLVLLGLLAGAPTILGAWIGGYSYSPAWTTLFFAIGAGAIVQVVYELWRFFGRRPGAGVTNPLNVAGLIAGMLVMYATGLFVGA